MNLFGSFQPDVLLRFDRSSKAATDALPRTGIKRFGPYDASIYPRSQIKCGILYVTGLKTQRDNLVNGLLSGDGPNFPGFTPWFRTKLVFEARLERCVNDSPSAMRRAAEELASQVCDLVFVIVHQRHPQVYRECKTTFLCNGVPCQFITAVKFQNQSQRPWMLQNIALAVYSKTGGTPWVVADSIGGPELVMGVSRAQDSDMKYVVGFVTLFNQDGDFLFLQSKTPVIKWEEYVVGLHDMVVAAYQDYSASFEKPKLLTIHFHKRPGYKEIEAVNSALQEIGDNIPYALVHINEFSSFRLFDTAHNSFVPRTGLQVSLSKRRSLLLLDGLEKGQRNRIGVPNVWDLSLDRRSTVSEDSFMRLVNQVYRFAKVNWRGFNARSVPVTINYPKLICDQVLDVGLDSWNNIVGNVKLRDKAWFL
jgi:hypothetical protein